MEQIPKHVIDNGKRNFGAVYSVSVSGVQYVFRPLSFKEAKDVGLDDGVLITPELEEDIIYKALIWPVEINFEEIDAGAPGVLSNAILDGTITAQQKVHLTMKDTETVGFNLYM